MQEVTIFSGCHAPHLPKMYNSTMPIYEYICIDCKTETELLRSFSEADGPMHCDKCGSENVKRKLSLAYAHSGGSSVSDMGGGGGCGSCAGGNCGSCGA